MNSTLLLSLLLACYSAANQMPPNCTVTLPLTGETRTPEKMSEMFLASVFFPRMSTGQIICYDLLVEEEEQKVNFKRRVFISLVDIVQEYEFKSAYHFSLPTMKVECECNCETYGPFCYDGDSYKKNCDEHSVTGNGYWSKHKRSSAQCTTVYAMGHYSSDCVPPVAATCCEFSVFHTSLLPDYTAVFVANPVTTFYLKIGFVDENDQLVGNVMQTRVSSTANDAKTRIGQFGIQEHNIEQFMPSSVWYFMSYTNRSLYTGLPINGLHEKSLQKLGWYKFDDNEQLLHLDWDKLRGSLFITVIRCSTHYIAWQSNASFYHRDDHFINGIEYIAVKDILNKTVQVQRSENSVVFHANPDASVFLHAIFSVFTKELFQYRRVTLSTFRADIDVLRNHTLKLYLFAASGWFFVSIKCTDCPHEVHAVSVSSENDDTFKTLTLSTKSKCPCEVCVYRTGNKFKLCENASCTEERLNYAGMQSNEIMNTAVVIITIVGVLIILFSFYLLRKWECWECSCMVTTCCVVVGLAADQKNVEAIPLRDPNMEAREGDLEQTSFSDRPCTGGETLQTDDESNAGETKVTNRRTKRDRRFFLEKDDGEFSGTPQKTDKNNDKENSDIRPTIEQSNCKSISLQFSDRSDTGGETLQTDDETGELKVTNRSTERDQRLSLEKDDGESSGTPQKTDKNNDKENSIIRLTVEKSNCNIT